ncbi:MAG: peptide ABC transporter substrate-binding protein [Chloroflexota bacterium]
MTRRDRGVVAGLVLLFGLIVGGVAAPALTQGPAGSPGPSRLPTESRPYREGILGVAQSVNPLTAQTRADQDLVALVFSGLVALGPEGSLVPGLARDWTVDEAGKVWTFDLRPEARWHDDTPVTADDVAFTVGILQDEAYSGPGAASWRDVTVTAVDERTVRFELSTPLGGFLQAATQPIVPAHLLGDVPVEQLAGDPFGRHPIGSGPFRLDALEEDFAVLTPYVPGEVENGPAGSGDPSDPIATPDLEPLVPPLRYLAGIELHFFPDASSLAAAYEAGDLDAASGLPVAEATRLGQTTGSRLISYPTSTMTAVVFNLRPSHPEFRDSRVRLALLEGTDRADILDAAFGGNAVTVDVPISPASWAYDPASGKATGYDRAAATAALAAAEWKAKDGKWLRPGSDKPVAFDLLSPDVATNPTTFLAAASVAGDWQRLGLDVRHVALPPAELVANRLRTGAFAAAVIDVNVGLDPDLYPLLASTQTTRQGLNLAGLQDPALDRLLEAARGPGTAEERKAAYHALEKVLAARQYLLPIAFRDEVVVVRDTVAGPVPRQISAPNDRFWDVLTWRLAGGR